MRRYEKECHAITFFIVDANGKLVGNGLIGPFDDRAKIDDILTKDDYIPSSNDSKWRLRRAFEKIGDWLPMNTKVYEKSIGGLKTEYALIG